MLLTLSIILVEPTSGLDSESAYHVMKFLDEYAKVSGRRVILTIHQPSSFIWQMIDNVVLLSKGKLMYQGPREEIEAFFSKHGSPCPPEYNPADHYVAMVNDEFRVHPMSVDEWEIAFNEWNVENLSSRKELELVIGGSTDLSNSPARRLSTTETTALPSSRGNSYQAALELTRRYLVNLYRNPGIIGTRVIMYAMLSIAIGTMFYDLGGKNTYSSIISRAALMFYCVSFFVFMSIAAVPFAMIERGIVEKEVRNGYYHPAIYQISQTIASIPGTFLLALITTAITLSMTNLRAPLWYFLNIFLVLNCAEALAHLVSHLVQHFVIGIAIIAGIYGIFMLLPGFILVPSDFPGWLTWTYNIAFHTYSWRSLMYNEFSGDVVFDSVEFPTGMDVLKFYEIEDVNPASDMIVLLIYAVIINAISIIVLFTKNVRHKGKQVKTGDWKSQ
jgi:ABC-type multidrug transport system permease subunit